VGVCMCVYVCVAVCVCVCMCVTCRYVVIHDNGTETSSV